MLMRACPRGEVIPSFPFKGQIHLFHPPVLGAITPCRDEDRWIQHHGSSIIMNIRKAISLRMAAWDKRFLIKKSLIISRGHPYML